MVSDELHLFLKRGWKKVVRLKEGKEIDMEATMEAKSQQ